ncbi:hypothetical protein AB0395_47880 [Streptosporangium sp. NPDC051023]|uniref:hypothetical protein n=1 Tax=Streptosporangium sp. NPDC051023 TaxID=3155410 RepID=UPI00344BE0A0
MTGDATHLHGKTPKIIAHVFLSAFTVSPFAIDDRTPVTIHDGYMPADYTIQIQMADIEEGDWIVSRLRNVTDERTPRDLAIATMERNFVADGADWRVRVWLGHDADPDTKPAYEVSWNEYES